MKKLFRPVVAFIVRSVNVSFAPYTVYNVDLKVEHFCWSWTEALEWLKCYDAQNFGNTFIHNFNGNIIAMKGK